MAIAISGLIIFAAKTALTAGLVFQSERWLVIVGVVLVWGVL